MDAKELLLSRRSIRTFKDEVVSKAVMDEVLEVTKYSPTWANTQTARYTMINDLDIIARITNECVKGFSYNMNTLRTAKNVCVISYELGKAGVLKNTDSNKENQHKWEIFDSGIATLQFCLAAHEKNVGTVIMGVIDEDKIGEIIGLKDDQKVAVLIVYGYNSEEHPEPSPRKQLDEIRRYL